MEKLIELEDLYIKAKNAYYSGEPILSDKEFDELEELLLNNNSTIINKVGEIENHSELKIKYSHITPMLSLDKIKTIDNMNLPYNDFLNWKKSCCSNDVILTKSLFEITPKYDGNAVNIIYKNGILYKALTRGDGLKGIDITNKLNIPKIITSKSEYTEIRGEVIIKKDIFYKKYSEFKNPRNFVAGVLNKKDNTIISNDLTFMPFEIKYTNKNETIFSNNIITDLISFGFRTIPYIVESNLSSLQEFTNIFNKFLRYRENESEYQLDGFVIKVNSSELRLSLGENSHHPNWAIAVKFLAKETQTTILDIEWSMGKTGEFTPIGILEPVDLDGSIVSRVSLHNVGYIIEKKLLPGAKITLIKSGDIIPMVLNIIEPSLDDWTIHVPQECPHCGEELKIENMHLNCINPQCEYRKFLKFKSGLNQLKMDFFGDKIIETIFINGIKNVFEIFDKRKFNKEFLMKTGLPDGKTIQRLLKQVEKINELTLVQIILIMGVDDMGSRTATQISLMLSGEEYSTFGLQKSIFEKFNPGTKLEIKIKKIIEYLKKQNINVIYPKIKQKTGLLFECTGSPKSVGFKTKEEFFEYAEKFNFFNTTLSKECKYLITDNYNSNSSKMLKAKKLNVEIITYEDFLKKYKGN